MNKSSTVGMIVVAIIAIIGFVGTANAFSIGDRGSEVRDLQISLLEAGYDIPLITSGVADFGYFGPQTQAALAQREANGVKLGAVSGPDLYSDYFNVNGVTRYFNKVGLTQASTTVCAIRSPLTGTSTLDTGSIQFKVGSTSAMFLDIAKATTAFATTTKIGTSYTVAAGAQASIVASTTGSVAGDGTIFSPGNWFVVKAAFATAATSATLPVGSCQVVFTVF